MKTTLKYLSIALISSGLLTSCDEDGFDDETVDIGGYTYLEDTQISVLDRNADINFTVNTADGVSAQEVEIFMDGSSVGMGSIDGDTGTFNSSILGDFNFEDDAETGAYDFVIRTSYSNGNYSEDPFSISVEKVTELDEDNPSTTTLDSLSTRSIAYSNYALSEIDDFSLMLKKNSDGTAIDSGLDDLDFDDESFSIGDTDYEDLNIEVGDTLVYTLTSQSGSISDATTGSLIITPKDFSRSNTATLSNDNDMNQLDLLTAENSADGSADGEIRFLAPNGFEVINDSNLSFVKVDNDFYENADVLSTKALYEDGESATSFTNLQSGDTFVYKVNRDDEDTMYGVFTVANMTIVNGNAVSIEFNYSEGN
ncbi:hypothetical protein [Zunongwangia sp. HRR-M8]|uniref:hypothetical protein n=1 Tax=Zunongwangia sp. HRR-M8 TaxID=3015170 RepID=UPI0022DE7B85|nr:hypothetical protein [Zunongwangia sp. HRR-M8]WBL21873.1 hypothetical protein PBT89_14250 [Zunongwangia sp. HRR-M8]